MTNTELTIEELKSVIGGFSHNPEWLTGANRSQRKAIIHPNYIIDSGHKVGFGGTPKSNPSRKDTSSGITELDVLEADS